MISNVLLENEIQEIDNEKSHLCLIYDSDPIEQMSCLFPFIKRGLESQEQVIFIAEDISADQLKKLLKVNWIDPNYEVQQGSLKLIPGSMWVNPDDDINMELQNIRKLANDAINEGFRGIRIIIEMNWIINSYKSVEKIEQWELALGSLLHSDHPIKIICQYNREKIPDSVIKQAFRTHPYAIVDSCLCKNSYYSENQLDNKITDALETEYMIQNILSSKHSSSGKDPLGLSEKLNFKPGTHVCNFYETVEDLKAVLTAYFKAGLKNNELCLWATSEPLVKTDAISALQEVVPDLDAYKDKGQIEIVDFTEWYYKDGKLQPFKEVITNVLKKEKEALKKGYTGLRASGNLHWLEQMHWNMFMDFEHDLNETVQRSKITALCSYPISGCSVSQIIDVVSTHQRTVIKRNGKINVIENNAYAETNRHLENKIKHRTMKLSRSLENKEVLLREIHHRVKNNLQAITSLLSLHASNHKHGEVFEDCKARIKSFSYIHDALYRAENLEVLSIKEYLTSLGKSLIQSQHIGIGKIALQIDADDVDLDIDQCMLCGQIFSELITNSLKYAFPDESDGTIKATLTTSGQMAKLTVQDDGVGLPKDYDEKKSNSLGMKLVRLFTYQLGGRLDIINHNGLTVGISFPLVE